MTSYATAAEVLATIADTLPSSDERRTVLEAAPSADQTIFARQATEDLERVRWEGYAADGQTLAWPRYDHRTHERLGSGDAEPESPSVAGLPRRLREAHAIQTATRAWEAAGLGNAERLRELAHRGVTSHGSQGRSESIDTRRASSAEARLAPDAWRLVERYAARGAQLS